MELVGAGLGHHADLARRARAVLGRVVARFHAELLHVLQAGLQAEAGGTFAVQVARRGVDDRGTLDAVEAHGVLLVGAAAEADVVERPAARGLRARRQQVELRQLPAVQRQRGHFALVDVGADAGRAHIDHHQVAARDRDLLLQHGRLEREVHRAFLGGRDGHLHFGRPQPGAVLETVYCAGGRFVMT